MKRMSKAEFLEAMRDAEIEKKDISERRHPGYRKGRYHGHHD